MSSVENYKEQTIFKSEYARLVINYIEDRYNDKPEFLWIKSPRNAIYRRKDNRKWYAALLVISKRKLNSESDDEIEIIDLKISKGLSYAIIDNVKYFPAYHMNKDNWITVCLDGSVPLEELYSRIDRSYELASN